MIHSLANLLETVILYLLLIAVVLVLSQAVPKIADGLSQELNRAVSVK